MKKDIRALAALLIASATFVACSSDNDIISENQQPVNPTGKYTMTINATKGDVATTRALKLSGHTLSAKWDANEEVLIYQDGTKIGTLNSAASSTEETTLTGSFENAPSTSADLTFYFHTAAAASYSGQDGTLATIASTYDFCAPATVTKGNFTVNTSDNTVNVPAGISFGANQQAIAKFTFLDKADPSGNTLLRPSELTVTLDIPAEQLAALQYAQPAAYAALSGILPYENSLTIPATTYSENGDGIIYLAIPDKLATMPALKNKLEFTLTATVCSDTYTLTKSGFPFENGQYYEITAKMTKQAPAVTSYTLAESTVGMIVGTDGLAYAVADKDNLPTDVNPAGMVAYKNGSNGLVIALSDKASTMDWYPANSGASGHTPAVTGQTWKLPSVDEWKQMFTSVLDEGYYDYYCNDLNTALGNAGGTALLMGANIYWSSTEVNFDNVYYVILYDDGYARFIEADNTSSGVHTRVCFAF